MQTPRRSKIRPPRMATAPVDVSSTLRELEGIIEDVVQGKPITSSFEKLYRLAYSVVIHKQGDQLYAAVEKKVYETLGVRLHALGDPEFVTYAAARSTKPTFSDERDSVEVKLPELKQAWLDNQISGAIISDILMYMDRVYVADTGKPTSLDLVSLAFAKAFHDIRYTHGSDMIAPYQILTQFFSEQLDRHRDGDTVDLSILEIIATCFKAASEHAKPGESLFEALETGALEETRTYYRNEAECFVKHISVEEYTEQTAQRIQEETLRCTAVFGEELAKRFAQATEDEFKRQSPPNAQIA